MSIDIGSAVEGTIVKLTEYGAIVRLQGGKTGLIHISEIADTFVRDVRDYFKEQDRVVVRVLSLNNKGRYELSTKHIEQPAQETITPEKPEQYERPEEVVDLGPIGDDFWASEQSRSGIEDQISQYMKESQERQQDLKKNLESKRGKKKR